MSLGAVVRKPGGGCHLLAQGSSLVVGAACFMAKTPARIPRGHCPGKLRQAADSRQEQGAKW